MDVVEDIGIKFWLLHHYSKSYPMGYVKSRIYYCLVLSGLHYKFVQVKTTLTYIWRSSCLKDCSSRSRCEYSSAELTKPHHAQIWNHPQQTILRLETWLDTLFGGMGLGLFVCLFLFLIACCPAKRNANFNHLQSCDVVLYWTAHNPKICVQIHL